MVDLVIDSVCLSVCLSVCPSACLPACLSHVGHLWQSLVASTCYRSRQSFIMATLYSSETRITDANNVNVLHALSEIMMAPLKALTIQDIKPRGPFLQRPNNFSGPESHSKIFNLTITELFYSHIIS